MHPHVETHEPIGTPSGFPAPSPSRPAWTASPSGLVRAVTAPLGVRSTVHFLVHEALPEVLLAARAHDWTCAGWTQLCITWQELVFTTDGWRTQHAVRSTDVPCPVVDGRFTLPGVAPGTRVEFALHVGVGCRAPGDSALVRAEASTWLNNDGRNYEQVTA